MKNSSYLISAFAFTVLFSCSNNKNNIKSENQSVVEIPLFDNSASSIDTTMTEQTNIIAGETENKKDTLNKNTKYLNKEKKEGQEASKHYSPDQSEIDSFKKAKQKIKN